MVNTKTRTTVKKPVKKTNYDIKGFLGISYTEAIKYWNLKKNTEYRSAKAEFKETTDKIRDLYNGGRKKKAMEIFTLF